MKSELKPELWTMSLVISLQQACNRNSAISLKKLTHKQDSKSETQKLTLKFNLKFNQIKIQSKLDLKKQLKLNIKLIIQHYKYN